MPRWTLAPRTRLLAAIGLITLGAAQAQIIFTLPESDPASALPVGRSFPDKAIRGRITVTAPPEVLMDGEPDRLSPGARIRGPQNELVFSSTLIGQTLVVNYVREMNGLIHEVWLLTPQEAKVRRKPPPKSRGPYDDGKTPFDQLPTFDDLRRQSTR